MPFAFLLPVLSWFKGNWILCLAIAALLLGVYFIGRKDEQLATVTKSEKETVTNYEKERTINKKVRDSGFDAVLDLNDRMWRRQQDK